MITEEQQWKALEAIYGVYEEWQQRSASGTACRKGCADCCTERVTITSLEGRQIYAFLCLSGNSFNANWPEKFFPLAARANEVAMPTFNELALAYRTGIGEEPQPQSQPFNTLPCPFLLDNKCMVYPVRPFACRSFTSKVRCSSSKGIAAEVEPLQLTVTTVFFQIIEHLDFRGFWGTLSAIMASFETNRDAQASGVTAGESQAASLRKTHPIPGFLIPMEEQDVVGPLLAQTMLTEIGPGLTMSRLLRSIRLR